MKQKIVIPVIICLPFLMFYWMIPFATNLTIGNDYPRFSIESQMELMFSLENGSCPLFVPGCAGGQSSSALTLGQLYHPISQLTRLLPGYWAGHALDWNTMFRLVSLGFAHLFLFILLCRTGIRRGTAFVLTFITVYNLRMLDLFRYGASLESWTGYLFLCSSIGFYCLHPSGFRGKLSIVISTYWLVCSGHPQMMYYGLIGAGCFGLVMPLFLDTMHAKRRPRHRSWKLWMSMGGLCAAGIILSSCYTVPFYFEFILTNAGRVGQSYAWANLFADTFIGTLNNFIYPLNADVHGAFGGTSLILLAFLIPLLKFFHLKIPKVIWGIWFLIMLVFLHIQGARTLIHYLTWKWLPFASSFRIAGRASIILPVFIMLLLAWLVNTKVLSRDYHRFKLDERTVLAIAALLITVSYLLLPEHILMNISILCPSKIRHIPPWVEPLFLTAGIVAFIAVAVLGSLKTRMFKITGAIIMFCVFIQTLLVLQYGTWVEARKDTPTLAMMTAEKKQKLT